MSHGFSRKPAAASVGPYHGSKAVTIEEEGAYMINISAKGEWSLKIE